jgi:hypothetical protein
MKYCLLKNIGAIVVSMAIFLSLTGCASFAQQHMIKTHCAESRLLITDLMQSSKNRNTMLPTGETCPHEVI